MATEKCDYRLSIPLGWLCSSEYDRDIVKLFLLSRYLYGNCHRLPVSTTVLPFPLINYAHWPAILPSEP